MLGDSPAKPTSQRHSKRATGDDGDHNMSDADEMEMEGVFSSGPGDDLPSDAGQEGDAPQGEASKPSDISSRFYASREVAAHGSEGDASLLAAPESEKNKGKPIVRASASSYNPLNERMVIAERQYSQQYSGIYFVRLAMLKNRVIRAAERKWKNLPEGKKTEFVPRVLDIPPNNVCFMVGTIYIDMPLKPNILDEVTAEHHVVAPPPRAKYLSDRDTVTLEDESGRVTLTPESSALIRKEGLVTGVVCALLGKEGDKGEFEVLDVCYPEWTLDGTSETIPRGLPLKPRKGEGSHWIALVSGLNVSQKTTSLLKIEMLVDFLSGGLGTLGDQHTVSNIVRTVVAGNLVGRAPALFSGMSVSGDSSAAPLGRTKRTAAQIAAEEANNPLKIIDALLAGLASNMEMDIMPGDKDPSTYSMPQQPLLPALLPQTTKYSETVALRTNPYEFEIDGCRALGTSGQTVEDIFKYVESEDRLKIAENTLDWAHMAPTAPDTLFAYPFKSMDPFVLQTLPDLYFIGNQPHFATSVWKNRTRVVLVPDFSKTGEIVLVEVGGKGKVGECINVKVAVSGFEGSD